MNSLSNARFENESRKNYQARRKLTARQLKNVLSGRFVHIATKIVQLSPPGVDANVDAAIQNGQYRDVHSVIDADGKEIRVARTKGETYLSPSKIKCPDAKRRFRREHCWL